jgi:hypothetical protein
MKAAFPSDTSVNVYQTARCYILWGSNIQSPVWGEPQISYSSEKAENNFVKVVLNAVIPQEHYGHISLAIHIYR